MGRPAKARRRDDGQADNQDTRVTNARSFRPNKWTRSGTATGRGPRRQEQRECFVCRVPERLPDRSRWTKLAAIGMVFVCALRNRVEHMECRSYILSKCLSAKRFAQAGRDHWSIENRLHWQLAVTFQEDRCRIRKGNADANFSTLRRTALSLFKNNHSEKVGIKNKRLLAALDDDDLQEVLCGK